MSRIRASKRSAVVWAAAAVAVKRRIQDACMQGSILQHRAGLSEARFGADANWRRDTPRADFALLEYNPEMRQGKLRRPIIMVVLLVLLGANRTAQTIGQQRMASVRAVDIVSLLGAGFCWGT